MAKVYTKTGDKGTTTLYGGTKVKKYSPRVEAYGAVDEANSFIGVAACYMNNEELEALLRICQSKLFIVGAELASDERGKRMLKERITADDALQLEKLIDAFTTGLENSKLFQLPGKTVRSAHLHVARSAVRRAERRIFAVKEESRVSDEVVIYMNRLSDFLFIMTRVVDEMEMFAENK